MAQQPDRGGERKGSAHTASSAPQTGNVANRRSGTAAPHGLASALLMSFVVAIAGSIQAPPVARLRGGGVRYPEMIEQGELQERRAICAALIRQAPEQAEAWLTLGETRAAQGEWEEANSVWKKGAQVCSTDLRLAQHAVDAAVYYNPEADNGWVEMQGFDTEKELEAFEDGKIFATKAPAVPPDSCKWVIEEANKEAAANGFFNDTADAFAPSTHVHVSALQAIVPWFNEFVKATCIPLLRSAYKVSQMDLLALRVQEAIVIRYDEAGPGTKGLKRHVDAYDFLITVQLNGPEEYEGGGLWIDALESTIVGPQGTIVALDPKLSHAALAVEKGTRYVLAVYISVGGNKSDNEAGYTVASLGLS